MPPARRPWARPAAALFLLALAALHTAGGAAVTGCSGTLAAADDTACIRSSQPDSACCSPGRSRGSCAQGYDYHPGEARCDGGVSANMIATCCLPSAPAPLPGTALTNRTCNKGYSGGDGAACAACIAGSYKDVNGSAPCTLCPQGKYSTAIASIAESTCSMCPDHAHSGAGSMDISNCVCNKGYTGANGTPCTACPHGTYKASDGSEECEHCPQNTFSNTSASVQCTACAYGTYRLHSSLSATNCSVCPNSTSLDSTLPSGCPM